MLGYAIFIFLGANLYSNKSFLNNFVIDNKKRKQKRERHFGELNPQP